MLEELKEGEISEDAKQKAKKIIKECDKIGYCFFTPEDRG